MLCRIRGDGESEDSGVEIHYLHAARPQRGHGRPFAVRQHRDADRIRSDGQTSLEVQACTVEREDDQLMPFVIHDQDVLAIGQDGEIVQVFAGADFLKDAAVPDIDEGHSAAALVGDTQRSTVVHERRRYRTASGATWLRLLMIALGTAGTTHRGHESEARCSEKNYRHLAHVAAKHRHLFHSPASYFFQNIFAGRSLILVKLFIRRKMSTPVLTC